MLLSLVLAASVLALWDARTMAFGFRGLARYYGGVISSPVRRVKRMIRAEKQAEDLQYLVCLLAARQQQYAAMAYENNRLRSMLKLHEIQPFSLRAAEITSADMTAIPGSVCIGLGSDEGCGPDMAVIVPAGVAGRITASGKQCSSCQLLTDPEARISARVLRTGVKGIVRWERGDVFRLSGVLARADVTAGDVVVTSGQSNVYPGGLLIGQVVSAHTRPDAMFRDVLLRSAVNFQSLAQVFVITEKPADVQ